MRDLVGYLLVRGAAGLFGLLPMRVARRLGMLGGMVTYLFARGRRDMAIRHMRRILGPEVDAARAARRLFTSYGRYFAESLWVRPRRIPEIEARLRTEGLEAIKETQAAGKGMVFALPHLGNWEAAATVAESLGIQVLAVAEKLRNPHITRWFTQMREDFGINVVLTDTSTTVMRRLEGGIARKAAVALLCDRDLSGKGVPVRFFGEETTMPGGPVALALRTGVPVFPVATYFEGEGHYVKVLPALDLLRDDDRSEAMRIGTQRLAAKLEELIMEAPHQWHLVQPNWPSDRQ